MNWKKSGFALTTLTIIILSTFFMQTNLTRVQASTEGTIASTELINFYSMTTNEATTFVQLLQNQGIPLFIVRLNAFSEWKSGTSSGIGKAKQIIEIANNHGIEVAVDLHTWYTTWDSYFDSSASNYANNRANYIKYVKNVLTAFSDSNVYAFMVMNEPQAQTATTSENNFILDVISAAKTVTDKPISVRFMGGYSPTTGHYSSAIDEACDFICRNTYWDARYPSQSKYGSTQAKLLAARDEAHTQGKEFWITEFGRTNTNLEEQRSYVEAFVEWTNEKDVDAVFCWVSQPDVSGEKYNIFTGYTPNPAFYELISSELPPTPPPPPPPEPDILFQDNFESGNLDLWTGTGKTSGETITVTSNQAHHGTYSVCCTKTGSATSKENAYLYKSIGEVQEAYANGYFRIDSSTGSKILTDEGATVYFIRFSDGTQPLTCAGITRESGIVKWLLYSGGTYATASTAISTDHWYNIELHWNADKGLAEIFVNGAKMLQITVGNSYKINAKFVDIGIIAANGVQDQLTLYCDCFRLSTTYVGPETVGNFPPWDVNQDGAVNLKDVTIVNNAYGSTPESELWDPRADVNSDGIVNLNDMVLVLSHYGEQYT
jgi:hypothetical protein